MSAPPDAAIAAGARVLAGDGPATAEHHWQALAVWRAMQAHMWRPIETMPRDKLVLASDGALVRPATRVGDDTVAAPILMRLSMWTHWRPLPPPPKPEDGA